MKTSRWLFVGVLFLLLCTGCSHRQRPKSLETKAVMTIQWKNGPSREINLNTVSNQLTREELRQHGDSGTIRTELEYSICYHSDYSKGNFDAEGKLWCSVDFVATDRKGLIFSNPQASPIDTLPDDFFMVPWVHQWMDETTFKAIFFELKLCAIGRGEWLVNPKDSNTVLSSPLPDFFYTCSQPDYAQYLVGIDDEIPDAGDTLTLNGRKQFSEEWFVANDFRFAGMANADWIYKLQIKVHGPNGTPSSNTIERLQQLAVNQINELIIHRAYTENNIDESHLMDPLPNPYHEGPLRDGFVTLRFVKPADL
ncbi:MAG: hypothetical protein IPN95_31355 [Bacteroidetes bacterium]|nr:hypothetical protein [Bacteroidota bacterium]